MNKFLPNKCTAVLFLLLAGLLNTAIAQNQPAPVELKWLSGEAPDIPGGVSWGVPWSKGEVQTDETFGIQNSDGQDIPAQSWPMAYWPDGSVKWTGFAIATEPSQR